jgi:PIN domain nuclease of toxin-antitoxin system
MVVGIADTHTALWYVYDDPRLSASAAGFIDQAVTEGWKIGVSAISLAELIYLVEKTRIDAHAYDDLTGVLSDPGHVFVEVPFTGEVAEAMRKVPRSTIPDMPDRMIAATASHLNVPVISRDGKIRASAVQTIG